MSLLSFGRSSFRLLGSVGCCGMTSLVKTEVAIHAGVFVLFCYDPVAWLSLDFDDNDNDDYSNNIKLWLCFYSSCLLVQEMNHLASQIKPNFR